MMPYITGHMSILKHNWDAYLKWVSQTNDLKHDYASNGKVQFHNWNHIIDENRVEAKIALNHPEKFPHYLIKYNLTCQGALPTPFLLAWGNWATISFRNTEKGGNGQQLFSFDSH